MVRKPGPNTRLLEKLLGEKAPAADLQAARDLLAQVLLEQGEYKAARDELGKLLVEEPEHAAALMNLAYLDLLEGKPPVEAEKRLARAEGRPERPRRHLLAGLAAGNEGGRR